MHSDSHPPTSAKDPALVDLTGDGAGVSLGISRRRLLTGLLGAGLTGLVASPALASPARSAGAGLLGASGLGIGRGAHGHGPQVLAEWVATLYSGLMDEPGMTPGRAARIYAYCAVAGHEAVVAGSAELRTLAGRLNELTSMPPTVHANAIDWPAAASSAIGAAATALLADAAPTLRVAVATQVAAHREQRRTAGVPPEILERSMQHGATIGRHVAAWAATDGAAATFTRPYTPPVGPALWRSTPPNFGTAIDPWWGTVRPMALVSSDACAPVPPVPFSTAPDSAFRAQVDVVLAASDALTDEGRLTSLFWRDNPTTSGLPAGHWVRIAVQVCGDRGLDLAASARVIALTAVAGHDAFVSCWQEKYTTNLLRPISYVRAHVPGREGWSSFVNTPQFPEYTSGHSVASQAAATVLTALLGVVLFTDRTHALRNPHLGSRSFDSFQTAAAQAANSRLVGGIHYPMGIEAGMDQGAHVGRSVLARAATTSATP